MVVNCQDFLLQSTLFKVLGSLDYDVHCSARFGRGHVLVHHLIAASGIDQMIKADAVDLFLFNEVENIFKIAEIVLIDCKSETNALPDGNTVFNSPHCLLISPFNAAKFVVDFLEAVKRYTDVADAYVFDSLGNFASYQSPIRR